MSAAWRVVDALGSRPLSVGLMAALVLYLLNLLGFSLTSSPESVATIAGGLPFLAAYALIAVNTVACVAVFWRTVRSRCRPWQLTGPQAAPASPASPETSAAVAAARRWLRWRGFSVTAQVGGGLHAGRGRFSALGSPVFHLSILLAAAGALVESRGAFVGSTVISEGQAFYSEPREYLNPAEAQARGTPQLSFKLRSVRPEYFGDELFFTALVAEIEHPVGPDARLDEVRLSGSNAVGEGAVTLIGFGYSLEYELRGGDGAALDEGLATVMIFPPGQRDSIRLSGVPWTAFIELFPNFTVDARGTPGTKGMALGDVRLGVTILRNRAVLAKRIVRLGEGVRVGDLQLRLTKLVPQAQFRIRRSPGVPLLGAAFVLMLVGLAFRLLWTRRELLLSPGAEGVSVQLEGEWPLSAQADLRRLLRPGGTR